MNESKSGGAYTINGPPALFAEARDNGLFSESDYAWGKGGNEQRQLSATRQATAAMNHLRKHTLPKAREVCR